MKFSFKLILYFSLLYLAGAAIAVYFIFTSSARSLETQIVMRMENAAYHAMDKIDRLLYERYADITNLASDPIISSSRSTPQQISKRLSEHLRHQVLNRPASFSFFGLNRMRIADTTGKRIGERHELDTYWIGLSEGKDFVFDIHMSTSLKQPAFHFAARVKDEKGVPFGAVVSRMTLEDIQDIIENTVGIHHFSRAFNVELLDERGIILYSNHDPRGVLTEVSRSWKFVKDVVGPGKHVGTVRVSSGQDMDVVVFMAERGYRDFRGNRWVLLLSIPEQTAFAPAFELRMRLITILSLIGAAILVMIAIVANRITGPVGELGRAAAEIGKGNLDVAVPARRIGRAVYRKERTTGHGTHPAYVQDDRRFQEFLQTRQGKTEVQRQRGGRKDDLTGRRNVQA